MNKDNQRYTTNFKEIYRPQFHFSPQKNWMNDPNGLVYFEGEYHLFYQHNPFANKWGHMSWGHAVSNDLVHWKHLPVALAEENNIMIFSGCVVADVKNSSGLSKTGKVPLVAIYTGNSVTTGNQSQCLAYSIDEGRCWIKFKNNPVLDISSNSFRDPKVFWHEPTLKWIMLVTLSDERKVNFYCSENLIDWILLSQFGPQGAVGGVWECPDFFPLAVDNDPARLKWLLKIDLASNAKYGGSGGQYFTGDFDGTSFKVDTNLSNETGNKNTNWIDFGKDFYAAASFANMQDGRCVWMGWLANWLYAENVPTAPWKNICSIPRDLGLKSHQGKIILTQYPIPEIKKLRQRQSSFQNLELTEKQAIAQNLEGAGLIEIEVEFECIDENVLEFGLELYSNNEQKTIVGFDCNKREVFINRHYSGFTSFHPDFAEIHFSDNVQNNKTITFHIFIDSCSIEVFVNNGEIVMTDLIFPLAEKFYHYIYVKNGLVKVNSLNVYQLNSIWKNQKNI